MDELKEPLTWDVFTLLPDQAQEEYLQYLINRFHVTYGMIAQDLFDINTKTLLRHVSRKGMEIDRGVGGRIPDAVVRSWKEWTSLKPQSASPVGDPAAENTVDVAQTVRDVVTNMQETFGRVRVTITIEPIS